MRVRTTSHGIAAGAGKVGAFIGAYALTALLPAIGLATTSAIVAGVCTLGVLATVTLLPEPKGASLEHFAEAGIMPSGDAHGIAEARRGAGRR